MQMCPGYTNQKVQNLGLQKSRKTGILPTEDSRRKILTMEMPSALTTALTRYLNSLQARNMSQHTITAYRIDVTQFFTWLIENDITVTAPQHISRAHIIDYLAHLARQGRSGATRARKLAAIRAYCTFLAEEHRLPASPAATIVMSKKERKRRVCLRVDEYMRLLHAAAGQSRDYAILQLFLQTGLRVEELTRLLLTDVDLDGHTLLIHSKGNTQRTVSLEKQATQAIRAYLADRPGSVDQHLFLNYRGTGLSVRGVMDIVQKYRKRAGIAKKIGCRSLRHTCVRHKAAKGFTPRQLQDLLGHEKVETSLIYVHLATTDARKLMDQTSL
jgi:integrase/recombinase XerD